MLRRDAGKSVSICDGFRKRNFFHLGRGFLPLLALMLLTTPQLAFAQDSLAVTVDPMSLTVQEEDSAPYSVKLDTKPSADVVITVVGETDDVTVDTSTLTFTPDDYDRVQTVTVRAADDANAVDETITLTHTATIGEDEVSLRNVTVTVTVKDNDLDDKGVTLSASSVDVDEAGNNNYTVELGTEPTATVTVDVGGATGEITFSPSRLFFTPDNYETAQTVTVYAGEDFDAEDDTATLTHTVRGGDYTGVSVEPAPGTVTVTVDDDDERGVSVSTDELDIAAGVTATYTVVLDTQPTGRVTIAIAEETDNENVSVRPSSLTFSTGDWNQPEKVTVKVDSDATGTVVVTHTVDPASSRRDQSYDTEQVANVTVDIFPAQRGVTLSPSSLSVNEGASKTYTVRLAKAPDGDVTVAVASSNPDVTVDDGSLEFTTDACPSGSDLPAGCYNRAQTVTVSAAEDADAEEDTATLTHTIEGAVVDKGIYRVTVEENDERGVTVDRTSLEVTEGASATYSIVLDSQPTGDPGNVTVTITGASGDVTVNPSQLTFNSTNWFTAQPVVVSAAEDDDGEPDGDVTLKHTVRGADYHDESVDNVRVTIKENETRGVTATPGTLDIPEGETRTYEVQLESQPTGIVTVMVRGASGDVTVNPSRLIFTTSNWDDSQTVEVKAGQDDDGEPDSEVTLTHAASGGGYDVTGGTVTVTIIEDDTDDKGLTITPSALTVNEGSGPSSYTVVLNTEPTGTVTVTLGGLDMAERQSLEVAPTTLTFTQRNWNIPQRVTVSATEDENGAGGTVTLTHPARGGGYDSVTAKMVTVRVIDNDVAGLTVTPMKLEIPQGSSRTYTVALNTKPTGNVTVNIEAPGGSDVTPSPTPLVFTPQNWSVTRPVRVHVAADATPATVDVTNNATATESEDSDYNTSEMVEVMVMNSEEPGVAVNPTSLSITEGGSASYTMVLTKAPTASVDVDIDISGASGEVRLSRNDLTFRTSNWNREQTVTVSLVEDDDAVRDAAVTLTHKVTGADEYEDIDPDELGQQPLTISPVAVTFNENDTRGVTVNPTSLTIAAGVSGTYRVRLNTEPTDTVTVMVNSPTSDVTVTGSPLIFTTDNWDGAQTVTVMVGEDAGSDEAQSVTLTHSVTGGDYAGVGVSDVTVTIPVEGTPGAPRALSATDGDQSVTLSWRAPANDGGSAIVRYQYRYQQNRGSFTEWDNVPGGASATSYTVTGLENGTSYTFEVRARNGVGAGQGATASATLAESAPGAPAGLRATRGDESVTLTWNAPTDGGSQILRYEYRYAADGETYGEWMTVSGGASARRLTIDNLTNGTEYGFQVRAVNAIDPGPAAEDSATPGRAPSMPTGLEASVESESITVMWGMPADDGGSAITRYEVNYRESGGQWIGWMTVAGGASATSHTIMDLTNGIGYEIAVRAVNGIGAGAAASVDETPREGLVFAHFANGIDGGLTNISDLVLVNVDTSTVNSAIYFYDQMGNPIPAESIVDVMGDLAPTGDGGVTVAIEGLGETTVSTSGEGKFVTGSVKVFPTGRIGGVLRFNISPIGVAGVGASVPVSDAIFPARRIEGGINTGVAIRNLGSERTDVTCHLMQDGTVLEDSPKATLEPDGQAAAFIHQLFQDSDTSAFVGSVRCMAAEGGMFTAVALEMDSANQIFTTLPVVPLNTGADSGESMLNFALFANGEIGGAATSSDLVFVNVGTSAVTPAIYFYNEMGKLIDASMVVDAMMDGVDVDSDGALMVMDEIPPMGEMTISTNGMGDGIVGSVRVDSDGPIGGVLRFDIPAIGVAGVGASESVNAAIFPARYMEGGINTGAAIRNLESEQMNMTCRLMQGGRMVVEKPITLAGNALDSRFITEVFKDAFMGMSEFEGSVHCTAPAGMMFTGVALEMDSNNRIITTLPVVPVQ